MLLLHIGTDVAIYDTLLKMLGTILDKLGRNNTSFPRSKISKTCLGHLRFGKLPSRASFSMSRPKSLKLRTS